MPTHLYKLSPVFQSRFLPVSIRNSANDLAPVAASDSYHLDTNDGMVRRIDHCSSHLLASHYTYRQYDQYSKKLAEREKY